MAKKIPYALNASLDKLGQFPAVSITRKDPKLAAAVSKSERPRIAPFRDGEGNQRLAVTNAHQVRSILSKRAKRNADSSALMKLLPDIELSAQILISSILSPQDMTSVELNYTTDNTLVSAQLGASVINRIKRFFEDEYKIKGQVGTILRDALFEKGAYPIAVIPENAIDRVINGDMRVSQESISQFFERDGTARGLGILGAPGEGSTSRLAMAHESISSVMRASVNRNDNKLLTYTDKALMVDDKDLISQWNNAAEELVFISDNPVALKAPKLKDVLNRRNIQNAYKQGSMNVATENMTGLSDVQIERAIYRTRQLKSEIVTEIPRQLEIDRGSVGMPLVMHLPSEAVMPVHVPGNPKEHVGYFVLLDEDGNPIEAPDGDHMHPGLRRDSNNSVTSNLIRKASLNLGINDDQFDPTNQMHVRFATQLYAEMVERDLISRVRNGMHGSSVSIGRNEEVYRLMLARVLAKKYSQLLYIPAEYMTYFAFKYSDDGIGRSLMDDQAMLNTIRSVMMFTDVLGAVKNSIGKTKVQVDLPEKDPNPMKTIEMVQDEVVRQRSLGLPLGVSNPADIVEWIQRAGYSWQFDNHPGLPNMKLEFEQTTSNYPQSDKDLDDRLRKASIMGFGLSPETVDNGFNAEFATTAVANNILLSKRVIAYQDVFAPMLSDHLRKVAFNSEDLRNDIKELLLADVKLIHLKLDDAEVEGMSLSDGDKEKLIVNRVMRNIFDSLEVRLPQPSSVTLEAQLDEFGKYSDGLDKALDAYLASDIFNASVVGNLGDSSTTIKAMYKAYFQRKWLSEKNVLTELSDLTAKDADGKYVIDISDEIIKYIEEMSKIAVKTMVKLSENVKAVNKDLESAGVEGDGGGGTSGGSDYSDTDTGGEDFGGDFGMGDLTGGGDAPSETPEAEPEEEPSEQPAPAAVEEETPPAEDNPPAEDTPKQD